MDNRRWMLAALVGVLLVSCGVGSDPVNPSELENPRLLVSGEVVRVDTEFSYKGKADFREGAHAVVTLCYLPGADATCELVASQRIVNVNAFPVPFLLEGDPAIAFSRYGYYLVKATIYMGPGDDLYIGDFSDNIWNDIEGPRPNFGIRVSGLERCNTPESGGACATEERP